MENFDLSLLSISSEWAIFFSHLDSGALGQSGPGVRLAEFGIFGLQEVSRYAYLLDLPRYQPTRLVCWDNLLLDFSS